MVYSILLLILILYRSFIQNKIEDINEDIYTID